MWNLKNDAYELIYKYSIGNYIKYIIIPIMEKNLKNSIYVCIYMIESLFCTPETLF